MLTSTFNRNNIMCSFTDTQITTPYYEIHCTRFIQNIYLKKKKKKAFSFSMHLNFYYYTISYKYVHCLLCNSNSQKHGLEKNKNKKKSIKKVFLQTPFQPHSFCSVNLQPPFGGGWRDGGRSGIDSRYGGISMFPVHSSSSTFKTLPDVKAARFFSLLESHSSMLCLVDDLSWSGSSFRPFSSSIFCSSIFMYLSDMCEKRQFVPNTHCPV